jgi:dihydroorotase-like cyclic amidohydrolase
MKMLLKNCFLVTLDPPFAGKSDLRIDGESIADRGETLHAVEGEETIDLGGRSSSPAWSAPTRTFIRASPGG